MSTDQEFTRIYNKKIMPLSHFKDLFLDFLRQITLDSGKDVHENDGVFGDIKATVEPESGGAFNQIDIARLAAFRAVDGEGRTLIFGAADSRLQDINIPPGAGNIFHVGLEQPDVEAELETNPRTGEAEYSKFKELPGRVGTPDTVVDNGGSITFRVNSVTESGEDHTSRQIRVWLKSRADGGPGPLTTVEATAFETLTVSFSTPNNEVTTAGVLGQTTVSTTPSDYRIQLVGPTVRRSSTEDLKAATGVFFLAEVTSVAASAVIPSGNIDIASQRFVKDLDVKMRTLRVNRDDESDASPVVIFTDEDDRPRIYIDAQGHFGGPVIEDIYRWGPTTGNLSGPQSRVDFAQGMEASSETNTTIRVVRAGLFASNQPFPALMLAIEDPASDQAANAHTAGASGGDILISDLDDVSFSMEWMATLLGSVGANEVNYLMGLHSDPAEFVAEGTHLAGSRRFVLFRKNSADTNWQTTVRSAATTTTDGGVAPVVDTFQTFRIEIHGANTPVGVANGVATARFFINGTKVVEVANANVPNGADLLGVHFRARATTTGPSAQQRLIVSPVRASWNLRLDADAPT